MSEEEPIVAIKHVEGGTIPGLDKPMEMILTATLAALLEILEQSGIEARLTLIGGEFGLAGDMRNPRPMSLVTIAWPPDPMATEAFYREQVEVNHRAQHPQG